MSRIEIPLGGGTYSVGGYVRCEYYTSSSTFNQSDVDSGYGDFYSYNGGSPVGGVITNVFYSRGNYFCEGLIFKQSGSSLSISSFSSATLTVGNVTGTTPEVIFNPPAAE